MKLSFTQTLGEFTTKRSSLKEFLINTLQREERLSKKKILDGTHNTSKVQKTGNVWVNLNKRCLHSNNNGHMGEKSGQDKIPGKKKMHICQDRIDESTLMPLYLPSWGQRYLLTLKLNIHIEIPTLTT